MSGWEKFLTPGLEVAELWFENGGNVEDVEILEANTEGDFLAYTEADIINRTQICVVRLHELRSVKFKVDRKNPWLPQDYAEGLKRLIGKTEAGSTS